MLTAIYKLAKLPDGVFVVIKENRGITVVELCDRIFDQEQANALTAEHSRMLASSRWYQYWDGEIVSKNSPDTPCRTSAPAVAAYSEPPSGPPQLKVRHILADLPEGKLVDVQQSRGLVTFRLSRAHFRIEGVVALTVAAQGILDGGQWFQEWMGEVVAMYAEADAESAEDVGEGCDGGVYRGQVVDQATGPRHRQEA